MNALDGVIFDPQQKNPQRIKKCNKEYIKKLDYANVNQCIWVRKTRIISSLCKQNKTES